MIATPERLARLVAEIAAADWVAVDTEADSLHAYPEKVCLIQLCWTGGAEALVDPLAPGLDLRPLLAAFERHELILHGCDYDLRLLRKHYRWLPRAVFDTMIAARLLGRQRFGLGDLVQHYLGVTLSKGSQKANWAKRPLTEKMENYAREDVRHLNALAQRLRAELELQGRLDWHRQACARLIEDCRHEPPPDPDTVWRVKGSSRLEPRALAVLREIWRWREREAIGGNRPPFFVLSHDTMVNLAVAAADGGDYRELIPARYSPRRRGGLLHAIARGLQVRPEHQPQPLQPVFHHPNWAEVRRFRQLERRRDTHAARLGLDPSLVAPRATLGRLAHNWEEASREILPWQRELLQDPPEEAAARVRENSPRPAGRPPERRRRPEDPRRQPPPREASPAEPGSTPTA